MRTAINTELQVKNALHFTFTFCTENIRLQITTIKNVCMKDFAMMSEDFKLYEVNCFQIIQCYLLA